MQPNISCVLTTKSSVNLLQRTPKKTLFWESFSESKLVVPDIINVLSIRSQLPHCSTYILGEDTMNHSSMRRKQQSKDNSNLIKGFTAFPCIICQRQYRTCNDSSFVGEHMFCLWPLKSTHGFTNPHFNRLINATNYISSPKDCYPRKWEVLILYNRILTSSWTACEGLSGCTSEEWKWHFEHP